MLKSYFRVLYLLLKHLASIRCVHRKTRDLLVVKFSISLSYPSACLLNIILLINCRLFQVHFICNDDLQLHFLFGDFASLLDQASFFNLSLLRAHLLKLLVVRILPQLNQSQLFFFQDFSDFRFLKDTNFFIFLDSCLNFDLVRYLLVALLHYKNASVSLSTQTSLSVRQIALNIFKDVRNVSHLL